MEGLEERQVLSTLFLGGQTAGHFNSFADAYRDEVIDFVSCIRTGRAPRAGAADGYRALQIAVAAGRSHRERRPVRMEEVTGD